MKQKITPNEKLKSDMLKLLRMKITSEKSIQEIFSSFENLKKGSGKEPGGKTYSFFSAKTPEGRLIHKSKDIVLKREDILERANKNTKDGRFIMYKKESK